MIGAETVLGLLATRHSKDVFIPACKDGPTWGGSFCQMDAWAMRRSWTQPTTTAYEIKVTRADFMRDEKWRQYLGLCNEFYFVAPPGVIELAELPADVGLLVTSKNAARLFRKRLAPRRDVEIPESLWRYIIMCRATIVSEWVPERGDDLDYWRRWMAETKQKADFGHRVGKRIAEVIQKDIRDVWLENERLERRMRDYDAIRAALRDLGVDENRPSTYAAIQAVEDRRAILPQALRRTLKDAHEELGYALARLEVADKAEGKPK